MVTARVKLGSDKFQGIIGCRNRSRLPYVGGIIQKLPLSDELFGGSSVKIIFYNETNRLSNIYCKISGVSILHGIQV